MSTSQGRTTLCPSAILKVLALEAMLGRAESAWDCGRGYTDCDAGRKSPPERRYTRSESESKCGEATDTGKDRYH